MSLKPVGSIPSDITRTLLKAGLNPTDSKISVILLEIKWSMPTVASLGTPCSCLGPPPPQPPKYIWEFCELSCGELSCGELSCGELSMWGMSMLELSMLDSLTVLKNIPTAVMWTYITWHFTDDSQPATILATGASWTRGNVILWSNINYNRHCVIKYVVFLYIVESRHEESLVLHMQNWQWRQSTPILYWRPTTQLSTIACSLCIVCRWLFFVNKSVNIVQRHPSSTSKSI